MIALSWSFLHQKRETIKSKSIQQEGAYKATNNKKKVKIVFFGDSLTKRADWSKLLNRNDVKNSGFGGFTTSHFRWLIHSDVTDYKPDICFIEGGINDIGVGIPLKRTLYNYRCLIDTLLAHNITTVVQSTLYQENRPNTKILIDSLNNFLIDYCDQKSVHFLDLNRNLSDEDGLKHEYSLDGTHLKGDAYNIWSNEIQLILKDIE